MAEIKSVGPGKTKNPQYIANGFAVRVVAVAQVYAPNPDKPELKGNRTTKITKSRKKKMKLRIYRFFVNFVPFVVKQAFS